MIRISHVSLPPGLSALAQRGPDGELTVFVSETLPADRQRAAVRTALRAARRPDWRAALPAPSVGLLLALATGWLRRAAGAVRAHLVTFATASAVVVTAGAVAGYLVTAPHARGPVSLPRPPSPSFSPPPVPSAPVTSSPAGRPRPRPSQQPPATGAPAASAPAVAPMATGPAQPVPSPAPSSAPPPSPAPSPAPSPSTVPPSPPPPSPPGHGHCLRVLNLLRVCLGISV
ncbi:MAG: hypothetical protein ACM32E_00755 [Gemmatimonadota bacterium]